MASTLAILRLSTPAPLAGPHGRVATHHRFPLPRPGAQTVGMGAEAQSVPTAAKLFNQANDLLGYDLLDLCTNGPKEKLDSTVISQGNYAVSGGVKGIEVVEAKAKSFKARMTVRLAVAGAFHTSFMQPAVSRLESVLAATEIITPRIPVISNVDAQPHSDPDTIKQILAREHQVTSPVQWETTVKTLMGKGLERSYELGLGKVIAGILKRINKGASIENISA